jgi:hypothetical protein
MLQEASMTRTVLLLSVVYLLTLFFTKESPAYSQCDEGYALCMPACATKETAERCMQRCKEAATRCETSGVFRMPVGFLLNRRSVEEFSRAEGELPQAKPSQRKTPR